ncbi:hypothetical protein MKW98_015439, partial [Papaver atlanticum]
MVEARNRIKGKAKVNFVTSEDWATLIGEALQMGLSYSGQLVIKESLPMMDIDEAVRRMDAATEHQIKAGSLLDFTIIKIKESERKKR